jgi:hypothetical protein
MTKKSNQDAAGPVYVKKVGNVRVAIWLNGTERSHFYNVTVARQYRDGDAFKESSTLNGLGDVACLRQALEHVAKWLNRADDVSREQAED